MRVLVFFDLPTETNEDRREYRHFRKYLIKSGFIMLQESVYAKLSLNSGQTELISADVKKNMPPTGLVQILSVTEKQFAKMELLTGICDTEIINTADRLIIL